MNPDDLNGLRDIHLPPEVSLWPPAPGWWLLAILLLLLVAVLFFWLDKRTVKVKAGSAIAPALAELDRIEHTYRHDPHALLCEVSILLRRVAMSLFGREKVAGLTGDQWLAVLDQHQPKPIFTQHFRQALTELPYQPNGQTDTAALLKEVRYWLQLQAKQGPETQQRGSASHV